MLRLLASILLLTCLMYTAQAQTFKGGLVAGANFTQIDGDAIAGYTKIGINAGFMSDIAINDRWSIALELLYSQKGSASSYKLTSYFGLPFQIKLHYADIPVLIKYNDAIGGLTFGAGMSLGRLVSYQYMEDGIDLTESFDAVNKIKAWDLQALGEATYMFTPAWGLNLRVAYSVLPIRTDCATSLLRNCAQVNNVISLRTVFLFSALKRKSVIEKD